MIRNIIFDLGGVIYDIRYENIAEAFVKHGVTHLGNFYTRNFQTPEMDRFELGQMTTEEFRDYIRETTHVPLSDAVIDEIINSILIDIPPKRIELLLALRNKYKVFLLSNTNQINYDCYVKRMREKYSFDIFDACFNACYFSHIMHQRKPTMVAFQTLVNEQLIKPKETLFFDDNAENLTGARRTGMHTYHVNGVDITDIFDENNKINLIQPKSKHGREQQA